MKWSINLSVPVSSVGQPPKSHQGDCRPGYTGADCYEITDICLAKDPCENYGICEAKENSYVCNCPIHFTGNVCQFNSPVEYTSQYKGDGYIELNQSALINSPAEKDVVIAFLFSTKQPNGLLAWYGQNKGEAYANQDFLALAVVDGYLEFSFRLNSEEAIIRNSKNRVDDGKRHIVIIKRTGNQATLDLDSVTSTGESRPTEREISHLPGNIFIGMFDPLYTWVSHTHTHLHDAHVIVCSFVCLLRIFCVFQFFLLNFWSRIQLGGAPDIVKFTGNRFAQGFNGCIVTVEGLESGPVKVGGNAVSGYNVTPCQELVFSFLIPQQTP